MACLARTIGHVLQCAGMLCTLRLDAVRFLRLCLRPEAALAAANLFLRKQLAFYQEHHVKPRRATNATRLTLVWLSQWFAWHSALAVGQPETFQRWRRRRVHLFWRGSSCPGRPPIPVELQALIRQMARDNLTWGQRRIANELRLKLGLQVSPRTVRKSNSQKTQNQLCGSIANPNFALYSDSFRKVLGFCAATGSTPAFLLGPRRFRGCIGAPRDL
jgi:hypothetical protein